jgi:hypothetical protein
MAADRQRSGIKTSDLREKKVRIECRTQEMIISKIEEATLARGRGRGRFYEKPVYCIFHENDTNHQTRDCSVILESKKKMAQKAKPHFGIKHS